MSTPLSSLTSYSWVEPSLSFIEEIIFAPAKYSFTKAVAASGSCSLGITCSSLSQAVNTKATAIKANTINTIFFITLKFSSTFQLIILLVV
nr:hypothetical protein [Sphingobacterium sp. T2]